MKLHKLIAKFAPKFGVESQHLYRETDLVDHALAGTVTTGKEFQVFDHVKGFVAIDVVHGFTREKSPSKLLFHDVPVLEDIPRRFSVFARHDQSNVTVTSDAFRGLLVGVVGLIRKPSKLRTTFGAAKAFASVYRSARATLNVHSVAALNASRVPGFFRQSSAQSATFGRAVHRVFTELLSVRADGGRLVLERRTANLAVKFGAFDASVLAPEDGFVRFLARKSTEFLGGISRPYPEGLTAAFANFLDRHLCFSYLVGAGSCSTDCRLSKQEI